MAPGSTLDSLMPVRLRFAAQLSSRLNVAETKLIESVLICLGENVSSLVQGGLGAKWAWHRYDELVSHAHSSDPKSAEQVTMCASDLGGIYYGVSHRPNARRPRPFWLAPSVCAGTPSRGW